MTRGKTPTRRGTEPPERPTSRDGAFSDDDAPTSIYDPNPHGAQQREPTPAPVPSPEMSKPGKIMSISMKTPADPNHRPVKLPERDMPHIRLRAMSEMTRAQQPKNLGNLAPPYDPLEARKRTMKEYVWWASIAVILASAIALGVWFLAT